MPNNMDYSLIHHSPDGTGMFLVTLPGTPDRGSYMTEQEFKEWIVSSIGGAIIPKGDILSTNLPPADASNKGWQYYCTDLNKYAVSDGTAWIYFSNSPIVQTPDATDTGHALSNAVVTQCCNEVKGRLDQHDARLQNLEQKAGDYVPYKYPNDPNHSAYMPNLVPPSMAKNGLVEKIVGKSRAWNQLYTKRTTGSYTENGISFTFNDDGSITVGGNSPQTATGLIIMQASPFFDSYGKNHKLLLFGCPQGGSADGFYLGALNSGNGRFDDKDTGSGTIISVGGTYGLKYIIINIESGTTINSAITFRPVCYDLTLIFGSGNEPSTVADALAQIPALGQYNAYDAGSLVSTEVSGVKSVGVNIWDEEWELGTFNTTTGADVSSSSNIRTKNIIPLKPNTTYYLRSQASAWCILYDADGNVTSSSSVTPVVDRDGNSFKIVDASFTTPNNVFGMRFYLLAGYGTTYNHDIQISKVNGSVSTVNTTYHPYKIDTLSLSETVTLRSAGSVADTDELNVEVLVDGVKVNKRRRTVRTNEADLGQCNWYYDSDYSVMRTNSLTDMSIAENWSALICAKYLVVSSNTAYSDMPDKSCKRQATTASFIIKDSDLTVSDIVNNKIAKLLGVKLTYETATYSVTLLDPILDPFIHVEGGGTIDTIQTQTPVIDNCFDVGYLAV